MSDQTHADTSRTVLFYGGCHAGVLHRIFAQACTDRSVRFDVLINYEMIGRGDPFPYGKVKHVDTIVFSPIENHGQYNTDALVDFAKQHRIRCITYPWLEWRGYFPYIAKDVAIFGNRDWSFDALVKGARRAPSRAAFVEQMSQKTIVGLGKDAVDRQVESTTANLVGKERANACEVTVADYIATHHRERRLFLSPDHPTLDLYKHICRQLTGLLELELDADFYESDEEPHAETAIPVFPFVKAALGLTFPGPEVYRCANAGLPIREAGFAQYVGGMFAQAHGLPLMRALTDTYIKASPRNSSELHESQRRRILAQEIVCADAFAREGDHWKARRPWSMSSDFASDGDMYLYGEAWQDVPRES